MERVKYICKHCGKTENYLKKELILIEIINCIKIILYVFGLFFIIYIFIVGITPILTEFSSATYTMSALKHHNEVRFLAVNITKDCNKDDKYCLTKKLFQNMSGIRYIPDSLIKSKTYTPLYVYKNGDDCEGLAQMFVSFTKSVGVNSKVECSLHHCVARVIFDKNDVIVDLTFPITYIISKTEKFSNISMEEKFERSVWSKIGGEI